MASGIQPLSPSFLGEHLSRKSLMALPMDQQNTILRRSSGLYLRNGGPLHTSPEPPLNKARTTEASLPGGHITLDRLMWASIGMMDWEARLTARRTLTFWATMPRQPDTNPNHLPIAKLGSQIVQGMRSTSSVVTSLK